MKLSISLILLVLFQSCSQAEKPTEASDEQADAVVELRMNNPSLFLGSDFGTFMQSLQKLGKYDDMLVYCSSQTRQEFSDIALKHFFQQMNFSFPLELKNKIEKGDMITLLYLTSVGATTRTIQMKVTVERDTCRLVLSELNIEKPFIGM